MRQIIRKLGMFVAMLWISISVSAYDFEVDGIYYNITSMADLEVEVTNRSGYGTYTGDVVVPSSVNYNNKTFTVSSIGEVAFAEHSTNSLISVLLPNTIRTIGNSAFANCRKLQSVNLPAGLNEISAYAFYETGIITMVIPESVKEIGNHAFSDCDKLLEVFFASNTRPVGLNENTFRNGHSGMEIYVPSIKEYGFGREYLTFSTASYDYTGQAHVIECMNNLKSYKCEIAESGILTDVNAGSYTKYIKATYSNGVDLSVEIPYEYTINKAPLSLRVNDVQREYGEQNPAFTCDITGFVNGENEQTLGVTPAFECEATKMSKVGTYRILASLNAPNYEISYKYGTLSVLKSPLVVSVEDAVKIYGNQNPGFNLSYSGLKNNETVPEWSTSPKFSTSATVASGAGKYAVSASGGVAVNYDITNYNPGTLTIGKRDLSVKANDCERLYGEENPQFEISYVGFVNGDSEASLVKKPIVECAASKVSDAGTYPIVVTGGEADNYSFVYKEGSLKINPLKVGFKEEYHKVTYNDMALSTSDRVFNYIPEIEGPFSEDDFRIDLWFLDKDDSSQDLHVGSISSGEYAGNYLITNIDRQMCVGKYIFNLVSKGTNPNVIANPSRAYLTVNKTSTNLEWNTDDPISVAVGEEVDLGISYQADETCLFNIDYNKELIEVFSDGASGNDPHWFATGLKEGETYLYFRIECEMNSMGFYNFADSRTVSKRIIVKPASGINEIRKDDSNVYVTVVGSQVHVHNKDVNELVSVYSVEGTIIEKTTDNEVCNLDNGFYIIVVGNKSFKIKI